MIAIGPANSTNEVVFWGTSVVGVAFAATASSSSWGNEAGTSNPYDFIIL